MRSKARCLLDKSVDAMVAALEVYNKPRFSHREESFSILAVNSWELLLKARLLQIRNKLAAILEYEKRKLADGSMSSMLYRKKNRSGNCLTIGLFKAFDRLAGDGDILPAAIRFNLEALVEIRDSAVHFINENFDLTKGVHEIGAATVRNYAAAVRQWFGVDLSMYSFALMPLAFLSMPRTVAGISLNPNETLLLAYLGKVRSEVVETPSDDFSVSLTIEVAIRRTKESDATPVVYSNVEGALPVKVSEEDIREKYPWSYDILTSQLQKRYSDFKANQKYHSARKELEADERFCRERLLDPANPKGLKKNFYSPNIAKEFDAHYQRATAETASRGASRRVGDG